MTTKRLKILAFEAYYGGSHRAFLDAWMERSQHSWELLSLPPFKWKWRMRHSSVTFARQLTGRELPKFDCVFCSDMTNLAELRGLAPPSIGRLPAVLYFHENQLTYPDAEKQDRDHHYAYTNFVSAVAAHAVWFNSDYQRTEFLNSLDRFLRKMPDNHEASAIASILAQSDIHPPGVELHPRSLGGRPVGPVHIVWAARWEADKNPEDFFAAMIDLDRLGFDFRLSVLGESFQRVPTIFEEVRKKLAHRIDEWGYLESRAKYLNCLKSADIIVSTAIHEFFGIAVVEAIAAGAIPVLPTRLSYPEILGEASGRTQDACFYDGTVADLTRKLMCVAEQLTDDAWRQSIHADLVATIRKFDVARRVEEMDQALLSMVHRIRSGTSM